MSAQCSNGSTSCNSILEEEQSGHVKIWWFPNNFSQSKLGDNSSGSNACTIIALLVAQKCHQNRITIRNVTNVLDMDLILALRESILTGNQLHQDLIQNRNGQIHLTIPEAIEAGGNMLKTIQEWKSLVYLLDLRKSLFEQLNEHVNKWYKTSLSQQGSELFVVLIAGNRSILFIFQQDIDRVTLVDTHQHMNKGAVIAQVSIADLPSLCDWYCFIMETCYGLRPQCYELTFLYFQKFLV